MMSKTTGFDAADYLDSEERQVAYIAAALESGDADFVRERSASWRVPAA
jgi:DNA-binding phage protein